MTTTTLSTKGQIVIPLAVRRALGWKAGDRFEVEQRDDTIVLRAVRAIPRTTLEEVLGYLKYEGPAKTIDEMQAAIEEGLREAGSS